MESTNKSIPFVVSPQVIQRPEPVTQQILGFILTTRRQIVEQPARDSNRPGLVRARGVQEDSPGLAAPGATLKTKLERIPKPKMERLPAQTINAEDAADIRSLSVLEFRTFADELCYVIRLGLNVAKERSRFEHSGPRL